MINKLKIFFGGNKTILLVSTLILAFALTLFILNTGNSVDEGISEDIKSESSIIENQNDSNNNEVIEDDKTLRHFSSPRFELEFDYPESFGDTFVEYNDVDEIEVVTFQNSSIKLEYPRTTLPDMYTPYYGGSEHEYNGHIFQKYNNIDTTFTSNSMHYIPEFFNYYSLKNSNEVLVFGIYSEEETEKEAIKSKGDIEAILENISFNFEKLNLKTYYMFLPQIVDEETGGTLTHITSRVTDREDYIDFLIEQLFLPVTDIEKERKFLSYDFFEFQGESNCGSKTFEFSVVDKQPYLVFCKDIDIDYNKYYDLEFENSLIRTVREQRIYDLPHLFDVLNKYKFCLRRDNYTGPICQENNLTYLKFDTENLLNYSISLTNLYDQLTPTRYGNSIHFTSLNNRGLSKYKNCSELNIEKETYTGLDTFVHNYKISSNDFEKVDYLTRANIDASSRKEISMIGLKGYLYTNENPCYTDLTYALENGDDLLVLERRIYNDEDIESESAFLDKNYISNSQEDVYFHKILNAISLY